jgi:hypothetical protein
MWEDEAQLRARFPQAAAWGRAADEEGGNVRPRPVLAAVNKDEPAAPDQVPAV